MSPRAAWRLESLGFDRVYDYEAGKADWAASGLPLEGRLARIPTPGRLVDKVPVCGLGDRMGDLRAELDEAGVMAVTTSDGVVLGRLRGSEEAADDATAEEVMEPGPTTVRYDESLPELVERMESAGVEDILVTTSGGVLVGNFHREHGRRALAESS